MSAVREAHDVCASDNKSMSFEQHNEQFAKDCDSSKCPPPAFTHAFDLVVKCLTAYLLTEAFNSLVAGELSPITCSACFTSATDFTFGEKLSINARKLKEKLTLTLFVKVASL